MYKKKKKTHTLQIDYIIAYYFSDFCVLSQLLQVPTTEKLSVDLFRKRFFVC